MSARLPAIGWRVAGERAGLHAVTPDEPMRWGPPEGAPLSRWPQAVIGAGFITALSERT